MIEQLQNLSYDDRCALLMLFLMVCIIIFTAILYIGRNRFSVQVRAEISVVIIIYAIFLGIMMGAPTYFPGAEG